MKRLDLSTRELAFVIATRAALGVGIGLLAADRLSRVNRRRLGATLLAFGAVTTLPALLILRARRVPAPEQRSAA